MGVSDEVVSYCLDHYKDSAEYKVNSFALFVEKAVRSLKRSGLMGYIIPTTLLSNQYLTKIRKFLLENTIVLEIVDLGNRVFEEGVADCMILVLMKGVSRQNKISILTDVEDLQRGKFSEKYVPQHVFKSEQGYVFSTNISMDERNLASKSEANAIHLGRLMKVYVGIVTGDNKKFISSKKEGTEYKKILVGGDLDRYSSRFNGHYVLFDKTRLWSNTDESVYLKPEKILLRKTGSQLVAALDTEKFYTEQTIYNLYSKGSIDYDIKYILGILNSKVIQFYFSKKLITNPKAYPYIKGIHIEIIPIRTIDFKKAEEKKMHDDLAGLVEKMLELQRQLHKLGFDSQKEPMQRQIVATDKKIDDMVYELYGLTKEEIKIVEESSKSV